MSRTITKKFAGRLAGFLYLSTTLMILVILVGPLELDLDTSRLALVLASTLAAGLFGVFAPWDRWHTSASLGLAIYALLLLAFSPGIIKLDPVVGFSFYVVVYVWIGVSYPRYTSLLFTPLMVGSMIAAVELYGGVFDANRMMIAITTLGVGVFVGEGLSLTFGMLVRSEEIEHGRLETIGMIVDAAEDLASQVSLKGVGSYVAWYAGELVHGVGSRVVLVDVELEETARYDWGVLDAADDGNWQLPAAIWERLRVDGSVVSTAGEVPWWADVDEVKSVLWVPIRGSGESFGAVAIALREEPEALGHSVSATARGIATQGGLALERVQARLSLVDQSMRDELTGVGNRRHAMGLLSRIVSNDAIVVLDLDHFKQVNDTFGHERGDELLQELAGYLSRALRDADAVARYGGDEFLLLLWGAGDKAGDIGQRLVDGWRARRPVTSLSVGIAVHDSGVSAHTTFLRADGALYEAKSRGRDQSVVLMPGDMLPTLGFGQRRVSELESLHQLGR
ncbi:MAG: GGDEF domain-containing protein [Actinobacteria bacterium]|nr:GGDEF domain-containing protein [Actinomycetota bacterium]